MTRDTQSTAAPTGDAALPTVAKADTTGTKAAPTTVDLSLYILGYLVASHRPVGVTDLAKVFGSSKATVYRHVQALVKHGFAQQEEDTSRYGAGIKLMVLGEALRERFSILTKAREQMAQLREATGMAVSVSTFMNDQVVTLEVLQGRTVVEFGIRPGTTMDFHATAHGKIALAFGPQRLLAGLRDKPLKAWTAETITDHALIEQESARIRQQGWATAPNEIVWGVDALAAPIFDHNDHYTGALAIIGSTQLIEATPRADLVALVTHAAHLVSRSLGSLRKPIKGEQD
jgi:DNA-binding IclR family transcriptional regulator